MADSPAAMDAAIPVRVYLSVLRRFLFLCPYAVFLVLVSVTGFAQPADQDAVVYITGQGRRYHRADCGTLRSSRIEVTLGDAVRSGYGPCLICKPPQLREADTRPAAAGSGIYRVNREEPPGFAAVDFARLARAEVVESVDGDTIRVRIPNPPAGLGVVETVRLIGVDTPETVHPRREVERFGAEAGAFTKGRLLGKTVFLAFDWDLRDRYGRLLAYVYTEDRRCHNAELIREGYGHAYTKYSFRFMDEFRSLEQEARREKRGLWGP
ncbi:MAG: thermonuclease family protein [Treponema sp.]|jgi:micrococcal nuclease|nr:thermonuclease family protein [Treponema sp.]